MDGCMYIYIYTYIYIYREHPKCGVFVCVFLESPTVINRNDVVVNCFWKTRIDIRLFLKAKPSNACGAKATAREVMASPPINTLSILAVKIVAGRTCGVNNTNFT
jgi:hypothetical protein